jgi:ribosomal biogenesis protein LAS1
LPPLPLLQQSVLQAIHYLHTYSFLPLLASTSAQPVFDGRDRAEKLVGRWKRLMKDRLREREVAEDTVRAKEMRRVRRGLEVEEVDDVVEALCSVEGMIPLARK